MSRERITLKEFGFPQPIPDGVVTTSEVRRANEKWQRGLRLREPPFKLETRANGFALRAIGVTGVIRIGHADLEIIPKFLDPVQENWRTVLWKILLYSSTEPSIAEPTQASFGGESSFVDLLASLFIESYVVGSARGLPKTYVPVRDSGLMVRGSFDISRAMDFVLEPWKVPFKTDFLSTNTPLARLLRWSAYKLMSLVVNSDNARALCNIVDELADITTVPPHIIDARRINLGAENRGLETAKNIAILLLEGSGTKHEIGDLEMPGFLWRSDDIFEKFVYSICRDAAGELGLTVSKAEYGYGRVTEGIGSPLKLIPDIVFKNKDEVVAICDAKYKSVGRGESPNSSDVYQMIAAAHVLGCPRVSLAYPSGVEKAITNWEIDSELGAEPISLSTIHLNLFKFIESGGNKLVRQPIVSWLSLADER